MRVPIMPKFLRTPPKQRGDPDAWRPAEWKSVFWDLLRERRDEGEAHAPEWSRTWQEIPWEAARDQAMKALEAEERERKQLAGDALNRDDGDDAAAAATSVDEMGLSQREYWDLFYRFNQERFFKDRHYLGREFPLLEPGSAASESFESLVEAGCGAGNTLFPLVRAFPQKRFFALDLSEEALALLRRHPDYDPARITALRFDLAGESEVEEVLPGCAVDVALLVFCLSAIEPCRQADALARVARLVRPGGLVLLRDYGLYDMTQVRFISKGGRRLAENTYMRADGTRVCYFSLEALRELAARTGLECLELRYDTRELRNRKRKLSMYRGTSLSLSLSTFLHTNFPFSLSRSYRAAKYGCMRYSVAPVRIRFCITRVSQHSYRCAAPRHQPMPIATPPSRPTKTSPPQLLCRNARCLMQSNVQEASSWLLPAHSWVLSSGTPDSSMTILRNRLLILQDVKSQSH